MYIKYRACVNINSFDVIKSLDLEDFCETFQFKKSNKINVCNNLQHVLYNSLLYLNNLFDKFAKNYYSESLLIN